MGNKTKIGKQRKDKYYRLAKETGYRSRAAFKLIQLNRRFEFLQKSRVCIDLCAAPGGWMQVAKESMPVSSIVVGVDLFPIKPVSGCISLQEDITTDKCRIALQKALQTWKADIVLNDGAPNVGKNWLHDAYQQACLTLNALKLATQFLRPGGWFITKVFRSRDYNPLLWVLKQLFRKVHSTKPQASRTESAEIFVVCQHYLAPEKLDARFLDPKHVFEELQLDPAARFNVYHPEKTKKAKAEGYTDDCLFYPMPVSEFLAAEDAVAALQKATEMVFDDETVANDPKTTTEIKECLKDIRVLGRKDIRLLLAWRKSINEKRNEKLGQTPDVNGISESKLDDTIEKKNMENEEDDDDIVGVDEQVAKLEQHQMQDSRRQRKKTNKLRKKLQTQMDLKMVLKGDEGPSMEEFNLFALKQVPGKEGLQKIVDQTPDTLAESDNESDVEKRPTVIRFEKDGANLHSSGTHYTEDDSELDGNDEDNDSGDDLIQKQGLGLDSEESGDELENLKNNKKAAPANPLITDLDPRNKLEKRAQRASLWFEKDVFKDLDDDDIDLELEEMEEKFTQNESKRNEKAHGDETTEIENTSDYEYEQEETWVENSAKQKKGKAKQLRTNDDDDDDDDDDDTTNKKKLKEKKHVNNVTKDGFEVVPKEMPKSRKYKLDAESLALGALMVTSKRKKRDIVDDGWNRYAFNDENLPEWFLEDEKRHMCKPSIVPQNLVKEYKKRQEELNVRPIKKVVEAKARKKKRTMRNLEKAKKKVETIMENVDISEREKARQIRQLYKKAKDHKKPEITYVVAKKHMAGKRMQRPPGLKGPYRVVDARMKKDIRKNKSNSKNKRKTKGRNKGQRQGKRK